MCVRVSYSSLPSIDLDKSELAHRPTNYSAWQTASKPYRVEYDYMWEPYVVVRKDHHQAVRYDERFVGYGNDKTSYTLELLAAGFEFVVLPESFILHVEHGTPRWRKHASFNYVRADSRARASIGAGAWSD